MRARGRCGMALALGTLALTAPSCAEAPARANVVVIVADDLGYADLGVQGGRLVPTPHIDSIASEGVRFTHAYVPAPSCSPSRAGLLTGRYPQRFGHEFNEGTGSLPFGLPLGERTLVERIRELGHATAAIGKWHLGQTPEFLPTRRGFDEFYGSLTNTSYFHPMLFVDTRIGPEPRTVEDASVYTTEAYAARAVEFIASHRDRPFLLYLAFNACHVPLQAPEKYTARFARLPGPEARLYAACLSALDDAVGRVLAALRENDLERSTLVFFLNDNGGATAKRGEVSSNEPLRGHKGDLWEGGIRVPLLARWSGTLPAGRRFDEPVISLDVLATALAAAGGELRAEWRLDGVDLLPHLGGKRDAPPHAALFWRYGPQWAVRMGAWKLVQARDPASKRREAGPRVVAEPRPRLIDLGADPGEERDLSAAHPEQVRALRRAWEAWNRELREPGWVSPPRGGEADL